MGEVITAIHRSRSTLKCVQTGFLGFCAGMVIVCCAGSAAAVTRQVNSAELIPSIIAERSIPRIDLDTLEWPEGTDVSGQDWLLPQAEAEAPATVRVDHKDNKVTLNGFDSWLALVRPPENVEALVANVSAASEEVDCDSSTTVAIHVMGLDLLTRTSIIESVPCAEKPVSISVPVSPSQGREVVLMIQVTTNPGVTVSVDSPVFVGSAVASSSTGPDVTKGNHEARPDVLLIILDAARADHFSYQGYHLPTSPAIDRLAKDAVTFENAYSECASTPCSIPNLLTGVSRPEVANPRQRGIAAEVAATTLSEYLKTNGYDTIAYSANGNNNFRQGFDKFNATWERSVEEVGKAASSATAWIIDMAARDILGHAGEQPLYLQIHLLPPHEPYAPPEQFDVFGDPEYAAFVHPGMSMRAIRQGQLTLDQADLEELVALYDGNIRFADQAVGEILDAWRESGRWSTSLIIITSDHGEAFFEHGKQGHNSTVFEEMLKVPLVIKPPGSSAVRAGSTGFVTLADVVPTVLAALGLAPSERIDGEDLLSANRPHSSPRTVLHYSSRKDPMTAVRSGLWKSIFPPAGSNRPALIFDLRRDPEELADSSSKRLFHLVAHALWLKATLASQNPAESPQGPLTTREEEHLSALGYLD